MNKDTRETTESGKMEKSSRFEPLLGSSIIFFILIALTYTVVPPVQTYIETNQIAIPQISTSFAVVYFIVAAAVMGVILFFIPTKVLRVFLKGLFAFMFAWGVFVFTYVFLDLVPSLI